MANYLNRPSIFEIATAFEDGKEGVVRKNQKTKTNVVINTNRLWYGKNSTVSAFIATAYDEHGNTIDSMRGYFLEPETDYALAKVAGGDKAIMYGTYNVIPCKYNWQKYKWYVDKVPGRTGIAIHRGTDGKNTEGCLMPGREFYYDSNTNDYKIKDSKNKEKDLFEFFDKYGQNGIKINIGI
jgi:hypothetical protein